ncbi:MAG: lipoyl(octanoyl) transferase LipB [Candidatus Hydrogenedentes bacterium]|nr:lipoyl(octanoyl) transferase LipB [Candidatus Hydrogenedentota bacterium]
MSRDREIETIRLPGLVPYEEAYRLQLSRRNAVEAGQLGNALFVVEHAPVITLGRSSKREHVVATPEQLAAQGVAVVESDRGGDVTYHGPGQLVAYPVLDLGQWRRSIRWYLRTLEEILIRQLRGYGLEAGRAEGYTGVWVAGAKVAAIGVGIHNWVTFHGIALNVNPEMAHFGLIVPCGIGDRPVTSLKQLMDRPPSMAQAMADFEGQFRQYLATWRSE